jgi:hypothetical protein
VRERKKNRHNGHSLLAVLSLKLHFTGRTRMRTRCIMHAVRRGNLYLAQSLLFIFCKYNERIKNVMSIFIVNFIIYSITKRRKDILLISLHRPSSGEIDES